MYIMERLKWRERTADTDLALTHTNNPALRKWSQKTRAVACSKAAALAKDLIPSNCFRLPANPAGLPRQLHSGAFA